MAGSPSQFFGGNFLIKGIEISPEVLVEAFRLGCRFDGWSDQFCYPLWKEAFEKTGLNMDSHTRKRKFEDILPLL